MKAIVYSNSVIGLVAFLLSYCLHDHWHTEHYSFYAILNGTATISLYNLHRLYKIHTLEQLSPVLYWVRRNMLWVMLFTLINLLISCICVFYLLQLRLTPLILLVCSLVIALVYVLPFFGKPLREWPYLKSVWIGLVWTAVVVLFPRVNEGHLNPQTYWISATFFFYFFALSIPADVRDLKYDTSGMQTFPQAFGVRTSKFIAIGALLLFFVGALLFGYSLVTTWLLILNILLLILLFLNVYPSRKDAYYTWIDASILLMSLAFLDWING